MEQYWMPKRLDFKNLRFCLDNYEATDLFIRLVGSYGGTVKVNENLEGKMLDFRKDTTGIYFLIDKHEVFRFPLEKEGYENRTKGFSVAYERVEMMDGYERIVMLSAGFDPYDPTLPEPRSSMLRTVWDNHLLEVSFKGRINLKFHSWWEEPHWKYWTVVKDSG